MLISVSSAPTEPSLDAVAGKMALGLTKMQKLVIGSICTFNELQCWFSEVSKVLAQ